LTNSQPRGIIKKKEIEYEILLDDSIRSGNGNEFNLYNVIVGRWNNLTKERRD
jgi:hypothetical protein